MLGPRSMGAGTYPTGNDNPGAFPSNYQHNGTHRHKSQNDTMRTVDAYAGIALTPAQRLIERYERMNTPPPQTPPPRVPHKSTKRQQYVYDYANDPPRDHGEKSRQTLGTGGPKKGSRSPIRQSLRNLLSVIKKGAGGLAKRKSDDRLALPPGAAAGRASKDGQHNSSADDAGLQSGAGAGASSRPRRKMTGSLLYLARGTQAVSPDVPGPLMWTPCSVALESNKLVVSSFTNGVELHVHEVPLVRCADIRSVSAAQLSEAEAALLDGMPEGDKMRVFEILFDGRPKEKFAAKSVGERAGWISAIWDGILPAQEMAKVRVPQKETNDSVVIAPQESSNRKIPVESPIPTPLRQLSALLKPSYSDRSLPPLPPKSPLPSVAPLAIAENKNKNPQNLRLDLSEFQNPISPSIYPPTFQTASSAASTPTSTKLLNLLTDAGSLISPSIYPPSSRPASVFVGSPLGSTPGSSYPNSPSIANLSQLSVVRQRLAQIDRNHSGLSAQSRPTTRTSTPTPSQLSASSRWPKRETVFHNAGARYTASPTAMSPTDSILERRGTPLRFGNVTPENEKEMSDINAEANVFQINERRDGSSPSKFRPVPSKDDVRKLSKEIASIKGVIGGESGYPTIHQMVVGIEHRVKGDKKTLRNIQDTLTVLGDRVNDVALAASSAAAKPLPSNDDEVKRVDPQVVQQGDDVMRALREVKDQLSIYFPALVTKLKEIEDAREKRLSEKDSSSPGTISEDNKTPAAIEFQPVLDRLEEIRALCSALSPEAGKDVGATENQHSKHIEKILHLIQEDSNKQTMLAQQQADSVRYLNELNTWLEAFVNNGTSQIQGISVNIERLCKELGQDGSQPNLVNDIRQLIAGMKARDQNFAALQAAVHSLLEVLTASQTQRGADSQAIAGLMDRQRHDQEVLFRAFTNEISGEIKGERLRFVEAMKEATAINVQIHVEQFKQELSREVMAMTEAVGHLHREKQTIENQISDLFSFYSKHKQSDMPLQTTQENVGISGRQVHEKSGSRANIPRPHNRLLPYPH